MHVYTVLGAPPEIQAYGLAKYSRSSQSLEHSIDELSSQRAEHFLNTFYFQYGHRSIADLAHITIALEDISMLAAFHVVDEPLWDGQGRSSRYQDFRTSGFYVPADVRDTGAGRTYQGALDFLLDRYEYFAAELTEILQRVQPRPAEMSPAAHTRTLRARAFDIARSFLPLATLTSNGQVTSARVLEQQISRLTASALPELREVGRALREACQAPAHNFLESKLAAAVQSAGLSVEQAETLRQSLRDAGVLDTPAAPTLVKYTQPNTYARSLLSMAQDILAPCLGELRGMPPQAAPVALAAPEHDPVDAFAQTLLYVVDPQGHAYSQCATVAGSLGEEQKRHLLQHALGMRGDHDDWPRLARLGYEVAFDLLVDFGTLRDLHRHRRCVQIIPDLKLHLGFDSAATVFEAGLGADGAELAAQKGLVDAYESSLSTAIETAQQFPATEFAVYLLPLGARQRALFKMDLAEAAYIIEQRTQVGGHFSYRRIAYEMYRQLCARYPSLEPTIRATNPYEVVNLLAR